MIVGMGADQDVSVVFSYGWKPATELLQFLRISKTIKTKLFLARD